MEDFTIQMFPAARNMTIVQRNVRGSRYNLTNELLCKICGRYLAVGCQCDSLKKQPCALCDQECADADALQKHMLRYHK